MALRAYEGFDTTNFTMIASKMSSQTGIVGSSYSQSFHTGISSPGVYGLGSCLGFNCYGQGDAITIPLDNQATWMTCFHFKNNTSGSDIGKQMIVFYDGSTIQCLLKTNATTGFLELRQTSATGTLLATGNINVCDGNWHYIQLSVTFNNTTGSSIANVDYMSQWNASSLNTRVTSNNYANTLLLNGIVTNSYIYYDNLVIMDGSGSSYNSLPALEMRVSGVVPNAAGNYSQWTSSAGSNYACVNQNPDDADTTFVSSNTTGNIDSYKFPAMPFTSGTIGSSMATTIARKDDVGPKTLAITARQSSTDYVGSNSSYPLSSYLAYSQRYDINDPSGSAWTLANVNAIEYGIKEVL